MSNPNTIRAKRPLSPHLQVYKLPFIAITSILHRATGAALCVGLVMFTWWLVAAAIGPEAYEMFTNFAGSPLGLFVLLGFSASFYYHLGNGIRHMFWDANSAYIKVKPANASGVFVLLFAAAMTAATWACVIMYGGLVL